VIRDITEADWDGWKPLWDGYLHFYGSHLPDEVTRTTFDRLARKSDRMFGYVAEDEADGSLVGLVHAVVHRTTWSDEPNCYLEDLFVDPRARRSGVARALIGAIVAEARTLGVATVYWHTQEFNGPGRTLYDTVAQLRSWVVYEVPLR
jgi:GNAT superfamily N-acetyltransferase